MKSIAIALALVLISVSLLFCVGCNKPKKQSDVIVEQIHALPQPPFDKYELAEWNHTFRDLRSKLASAYIDEDNCNSAIALIQQQIDDNRQPAVLGKKHKMWSTNYTLEAAYYGELAYCYGHLKNTDAQQKAFAKKAQAESMASKLKPQEDAEQKQSDKNRKDSYLN